MPVVQRPGSYSYHTSHMRQPAAPRKPRVRFNKLVFAIVACLLLVSFVHPHARAATPAIKSGIAGQCLDVFHDDHTAQAVVDMWTCNKSTAQSWSTTTNTIVHGSPADCLTIEGITEQGDKKVNLQRCGANADQIWLRDQGGFFNPHTGLCLQAGSSKTGAAVTAGSCANLGRVTAHWQPTTASGSDATTNCTGSQGQKIACYAEKEWTTWQSNTPSHTSLLTTYSDGAPYEEWCADFVSYVYKEAGYPFSAGETNGWNENVADNIQNMGFTRHDVSSGYIPQPGDVAYFDYNGGHVEIVVAGGKTPTFVYGNSGTIDPTTGNGQMAANTITSDPTEGSLVYYLSPNHQ